MIKERKKIDPQGLVGGFASQYDLISSEYGWDDEKIGELPFMRFQQISSAILLRKAARTREENYRTSWLARSMSMFVAGGYMTDGKSENTAIREARNLAFDKVEKIMLAHAEEHPPTDIAADAKPGSFERMLAFMGQTRD